MLLQSSSKKLFREIQIGKDQLVTYNINNEWIKKLLFNCCLVNYNKWLLRDVIIFHGQSSEEFDFRQMFNKWVAREDRATRQPSPRPDLGSRRPHARGGQLF